jgi:hypothetical protein
MDGILSKMIGKENEIEKPDRGYPSLELYSQAFM